MSTTTAEPLRPSAAPARRRNGMGTAALVVGVVALVLAVLIIFFPLAALLGILGAIFGIIGMRRVSRGEADNRAHAVAGVVTGLLAVAIAISIGVRLGTFINDHQGDFRRFWSCITSAPSDAEQEDCARELADALE
jgi:hypothetical protein